ncbi:hypothetical protein [Mucilaginibacter gilvus]|uniref:Uncharacterized protein n=1 Tax=Mucilaginibacter gilvus TaxID=2305909 RepID=A0A444MLR9_9SPHI|nr:hypothetical protein [Mucilaginibacter gilvus]RWY50222.1 hypothetical protein EPL05_15855 [Mucilaginibacter gilvus]
MKKSFALILFTFITCIFCQSCHLGGNRTWANDHIDESVRTEIHALNKKLFQAFMAKDAASGKQLMSPALLAQTGAKIDTIISAVGESFQAADYDVIDEYYTKNTTTGINVVLPSNKGNNNDYTLTYTALNKEMYASLLAPKDLSVNCMILAIYGKYDDGWKINILHVGEYTILGKAAPDYYAEALKLYDKGSIIDAANTMFMAAELRAPGDKYLTYKVETQMQAFYNKMLDEANTKYKFPVSLTRVKTAPKVFAISPQFLGEDQYKGVYPIIKYQSAINLADTVALKVENNAIQKVIGDTFKGIDEDKAYVVYQAFNQIPDGKTPAKHYGFIEKLK